MGSVGLGEVFGECVTAGGISVVRLVRVEGASGDLSFRRVALRQVSVLLDIEVPCGGGNFFEAAIAGDVAFVGVSFG